MEVEYSRSLAKVMNTKKALALTVLERESFIEKFCKYKSESELPPSLLSELASYINSE